jgi:hypothetical protein
LPLVLASSLSITSREPSAGSFPAGVGLVGIVCLHAAMSALHERAPSATCGQRPREEKVARRKILVEYGRTRCLLTWEHRRWHAKLHCSHWSRVSRVQKETPS